MRGTKTLRKAKTKRKKRDKQMRNISRVDQAKKNQHGWFVRVMRNGITHQKFFYDKGGNEAASLREAKRFRDELLRLYPLPKRGNMFNRMSARNTSGHAGVSRTGSYRKGHYYQVWQASWILKPGGKRITRKFGFSPNGRSERQAKRLAIKARREALEALET